MMIKVLIPQAFENMEEATIGCWLKTENAPVRLNDALCELITEKTTFDLPAENLGLEQEVLLRRIVAPEKSIVPVGYCIALLGEVEEDLTVIESEVQAENAAVLATRNSAGSAPDASTAALQVPFLNIPSIQVPSVQVIGGNGASNVSSNGASTPGGSRIRATPAARRAARDRNVAIEDVAAAFPGKVLTEDDVANFAA